MRLSRHRSRGLLALSVTLVTVLTVSLAQAQATSPLGPDGLPTWVSSAGARHAPPRQTVFSANTYGAVGGGVAKATKAIQKAIDACAEAGGGVVDFLPGTYLTGALFLKSNVHLRVGTGVTLLGSQDDADYPELPTRVAGVDMTWPAALINVNGQKDVEISGGGVIDGQGQKWWDKYRVMRAEYDPRGLRWAVDYDCQRVRLVVIWKSSDVTIRNVSLKRSGFWTVQVVYSDHVTADGVKVSDNAGPSTDGIDVDSSRYVLVQHCDIDNDDDDICLKAGRDADGLRVNRPTEYVVVRDNIARRGGGVTSFGSETSGGIRHVVVLNNQGIGTSTGINFKSAKTRGGYVEDVLVRGLTLDDVRSPFVFTLNWNPSYSDAALPPRTDPKHIPPAWVALTAPVTPPSRGLADFRDITIEDVQAVGARQAFTVAGLAAKPIQDVRMENVTVQGQQAGSIQYASCWTMKNVTLETPSGQPVAFSGCTHVEAPTAEQNSTQGEPKP